MVTESIRQAIVAALAHAGVGEPDAVLEHPAVIEHGDYSTSVALKYGKELGLAPRALAEKLVASIGTIDGVERVEIAGPGFINFHLASKTLHSSLEKARGEDMWGGNADIVGKKIMVEYTDPNLFKAFHIGHLMSNAIGESISRLLQFSSAEVKRANYQGDVGPHVAKAIWAMQRFSLDANSAESLGDAYTRGSEAYESDPEAKKEIDTINAQVYDKSDKAVNRIYSEGRAASLRHFEEIYKKLGTRFDHYFFESDTAPRGVAIVRAHPDVFEESEGAIVYRGEKVGLHTRVFLTSKGLPTYETKDLGLAELKAETWPADEFVSVTAEEQAAYFRVVVAAMREVMPRVAEKIVHISHGMMRFADGKMSSRKGNVITGESLLTELTEVAAARAKESRSEKPAELAEQVAVAAIKYQVLKQASGKDIIFDRERALSLEGDSGPYLQYAHARACQILAKAKDEGVVAKLETHTPAQEVVRLVHRFPEIVARAAQMREPHILTNFLTSFAGAFNSWYAEEQILDGTEKAAHKVAVVEAVARTLKNGLWILGIPAPEKM